MTNPQDRLVPVEQVLPREDWQWLADQLRAWPTKRVHPDRTMCEATLRPMEAAVIEEALDRLASSPTPIPVSGEVERVAELVAEGDGVWVSCTGCQESVDGCVSLNDYPYSETFKCQPGGGCGECGGIGVIWDREDYAEMADFMIRHDRTFDAVKAICLNAGMPDYRVQDATQAIMELDPPAPSPTPEGDTASEARAREVLQEHVKMPLADIDFMLGGELDAVVRAMLAFAADPPAPQPASGEVRDKLRSTIKSIINAHVRDCLNPGGGVKLMPRHPGPAADAILAALSPQDHPIARANLFGDAPEQGPSESRGTPALPSGQGRE